jgi:uncharacterized Ntn-hydrolase superfamily protein
MTYTIMGRCPRTGELGIAIATYSVAVGGLCPEIRSNVGAITSQAFVNPEFRELAMNLLAAGHTAGDTLSILEKGDPSIVYRQVGILDREGRVAVLTGSATRSWAGHLAGDGFVALGNVLQSEAVVAAMAETFIRTLNEPLAERLVCALEAGRDAGGQMGAKNWLPERSASLLVHGHRSAAEIDLRADMHPRAVEELRRIHDSFKPYIAFNRLRWLDPAKAPPQEAFVAQLKEKDG